MLVSAKPAYFRGVGGVFLLDIRAGGHKLEVG